jgi:hypothetical protein
MSTQLNHTIWDLENTSTRNTRISQPRRGVIFVARKIKIFNQPHRGDIKSTGFGKYLIPNESAN